MIDNLLKYFFLKRRKPLHSSTATGDKGMTIGLPQTLIYHLHPQLWETFFEELGIGIVKSSPTTAETLQKASLISESEHCLPVKLFDAHVAELAEHPEVNVVFAPRILSTRKGHIACPKLGALPDSIRADFGSQVKVLTIEIDERRNTLFDSLLQMGGKILGFPKARVKRAAEKALNAMGKTWEKLIIENACADSGKPKYLILSHPYNLYTSYFLKPIIAKLINLDSAVEFVDYQRVPNEDNPVKWDMSSIMYDTLNELDSKDCSGVIQLTSFNCGCDSIVSSIFHDLLRHKGIPLMTLVLDEHTAQAGIDTRLEAFVDSISVLASRNSGS